MHLRRLVVPALLMSLVGVSMAHASPARAPRIDPTDLKQIALLKDIKPGMIGYGKTVFQGTKIETFKVKVLGVLKKANFGTDLILIKMEGGPMTGRGANLIQGMSGSPIYINGKIAGAFAYGEQYAKEPIGMVTPIEFMLDAWSTSLPSKPSSFSSMSADLDKPIALSTGVYDKVAIDSTSRPREDYDDDTLVFRPLSTPLIVSGLSQHSMARLRDSLRPLNMQPIAGPGQATDKAKLHVDIQPGASVGVSLVSGDVEVSGVGTVTYRRGNKILAFGHPMVNNSMMSGIGAIDALFSTAYVYDVFPGLSVSHKIAAPITPIGRMFQDRPWSIACELGKLPEMIPVTIHVSDEMTKRKRDFNVRVVNHPMLTGDFVLTAVSEAIYEMRGSPSDAMAKVDLAITADEIGTIHRQNTYFDPISIDMAAVADLEQILGMLRSNPFHPVPVRGVDVSVNLTPAHMTAKLERAFLKESKFEPGDTVEIGAVLRPFKGERLTKTVSIKLPNNMPNGAFTITVGGGSLRSPGSDLGGPGIIIISTAPAGPQQAASAENVTQLIKRFLEREHNNDLVAKIVLPRQVPSIAGEKFTALPPTIADAMRSPKSTSFATEAEDIKAVTPTEWIISGTQRLSITVKRRTLSEKQSPASARRPSAPPSAQESDADDQQGSDASDGPDAASTSLTGGRRLSMAAETPVPPKAGSDASQPAPAAADDDRKSPGAPGEAPEAKKEAPASGPEKPVGKQPLVWRQTDKSDFALGNMTNVAATSGDFLTLAGTLQPMCVSTETYVWSLLPDGNGGAYAGTGNHGIVYRISGDGKCETLFASPELEVNSLARDASGAIYAGTSPHGVVYKITPDGKGVPVLHADEKYIAALATDSKGNVYAAAGDKCKVYKITPDGRRSVALETPEYFALSLAVDKSDNLYVGTGPNGIVYKVRPDGAVSVLFDAAEEYITALSCDDGTVYAGASPKGVVYRIAPNAAPKTVFDKAGQGIVSIASDGAGGVYAANAANVFRILPDETVYTLENRHDVQFLSLAISGGQLLAGTGNVGSIYHANAGSIAEGTYDSTVHDCGSIAAWGSINWTADLPKSAFVSIRTRTGDVSEPDATWTAWSDPYPASGARIANPTGRYVQYRAVLTAGESFQSPKLRDVSISCMPRNEGPKVKLTSPKSDDKWSKKQTIKWQGTDPDKDRLIYELFSSDDSGLTWKPLGGKSEPAPSEKKPEPSKQRVADDSYVSDDDTALDPEPAQLPTVERPDDSPSLACAAPNAAGARDSGSGAKIPAQSPPAKEPAGPSKPPVALDAKPANMTTESSFPWDTSGMKDGTYRVKIVASDRLSNPADALSSEDVSEPFVVANKPPKIIVFRKAITVHADRTVTVSGNASQGLVSIAGVQYKLGSWEWAAAAPQDGVFDSKVEDFTFTTQPLAKGDHLIEIKAIDQAGNAATLKIPVKVS